ncbi:hypothetical protein D3C75_1152710 [compost metagenome]
MALAILVHPASAGVLENALPACRMGPSKGASDIAGIRAGMVTAAATGAVGKAKRSLGESQ